jgi:PiT family inorganic phosphate transporter
MLREMKHKAARPVDQQERPLTKAERKDLRRVYRKELVKRSAVMKIISAWLVTVPISAFLGAILYYTFRGMLLP